MRAEHLITLLELERRPRESNREFALRIGCSHQELSRFLKRGGSAPRTILRFLNLRAEREINYYRNPELTHLDEK